jgi:hypothetical protein
MNFILIRTVGPFERDKRNRSFGCLFWKGKETALELVMVMNVNANVRMCGSDQNALSHTIEITVLTGVL